MKMTEDTLFYVDDGFASHIGLEENMRYTRKAIQECFITFAMKTGLIDTADKVPVFNLKKNQFLARKLSA